MTLRKGDVWIGYDDKGVPVYFRCRRELSEHELKDRSLKSLLDDLSIELVDNLTEAERVAADDAEA